jgi:hypothetical protein
MRGARPDQPLNGSLAGLPGQQDRWTLAAWRLAWTARSVDWDEDPPLCLMCRLCHIMLCHVRVVGEGVCVCVFVYMGRYVILSNM